MWQQPPSFLQVKKNGEPIESFPSAGKNYGITSESLVPGLIPFFEEHCARTSVGYTLPEWEQLHWSQRAIEVAVYRLKNMVENQQMDEISKNKPRR